MPPLKRVPLLVDLAIKNLNHLVRVEALQVAYNVVTYYVFDEIVGSDDYDEEREQGTACDREIYLNDQVEEFKNHVLEHVPYNLIEKVLEPVLIGISEAILVKKREWTPLTNMTKFTRQMYAIIKFANLMVLPNRRTLDLDKIPKMIRTKLYGNLPAFKNLTTLILGSGSGGWVPEAYADKFLLGLPHMNHLVHFSLKYDCTENVLQVLSETCGKTLRVLDIERSRQVRDDAVPYIKSCAELVSINIFQTDLTTQGQADVLLGLPQLRHLDRGDFLADAIEHLHNQHIMGKELKKMPSLKVQEFWASEEYYFHTEEQMAQVSRYCPDIRQMLFMFQKTSCELSVLASFPHLEDLDLWGGAFYTDGLSDLLEQIGHRLKKLSLVHVEEMDTRAFAIITLTCPNLVKLGLHNCDLIDDEEGIGHNEDDPFRDADRILRTEKWREVQKMVTPMSNLEIIRIASQCSEQYLTFLLSQCLNIKEIMLGISTSISDKVWSDVLVTNGMRKLEKIHIQKCSKVTMHSIELMLANCDRLKSIMDLAYFEGIHENELKILKLSIREQNLDIELEDNSHKTIDLNDSNFMNYKQQTDKFPAFDNSIEWETGI